MTTPQQTRHFASMPKAHRKIIARIIQRTAEVLEIDLQHLLDPEITDSPYANGRRYAMAIIRDTIPSLSLDQIGGVFARSSSTVSKDTRGLSMQMARDPKARALYERIKS